MIEEKYFILLIIMFVGLTIYYNNIILDLKQKQIQFPIKETSILNSLPIAQLLEDRDRTLLSDPIVAPERRIENHQYPMRIKHLINIPTRGYPDNYQLIGLLNRNSDEKILQLFGRPTYPGSNLWEYFVTTEQYGFANKIPLDIPGKKEINDGDVINIPMFDKNKGDFQVKLYNYNTPRYYPNVI
jgi:hypothetical protein